MRISPLLATTILLLPLASALMLPAPALPPPLPANITDAEVLMLLGPTLGAHPSRTTLAPPVETDLVAMLEHFARRAGVTLSPEDAEAFAQLDPRVAAPTLTLLAAVDQAWTMRDEVFNEHRQDGMPLAPEETEMLLNAAILLSDTIESIVIPQLQAAATSSAWPTNAIADPVGILRIGGTGHDKETIDRIVQLDARGDDAYYNNAGGAAFINDFRPQTPDYPISVHIDLSGNDKYRRNTSFAMGGSYQGIGLFYELSGADTYHCLHYCLGAGGIGVGIFREIGGDDAYTAAESMGYAADGLGYAREDAGDDHYLGGARAFGATSANGLGLFWDRNGVDLYETAIGARDMWGFTEDSRGEAWFVEESPSIDTWRNLATSNIPLIPCNDCTWNAGITAPNGRGNDNRGGVAYLVAYQAPLNVPLL